MFPVSLPGASGQVRWPVALALLLALGGPAAFATAPQTPPELQLLRMEHDGRARPQEVAAELAQWLRAPAIDAPLRISGLQLLGTLQAVVPDDDAAERTAKQLEALAQQQPALAEPALAAAGFVRARLLYRTGPLTRADRVMGEAIARLPEGTPPAVRLRYLLLHGDIKDRAGKLDDAVRLYLQALTLADNWAPPWRRSEVRSSLAFALNEAGQRERARAFNREAIALAREAREPLELSYALTTESFLLEGLNQDQAELAALTEAIEQARLAGAKRDEALGLANIADFYLKREQYATALEMAQRALPLTRELRNASSEQVALSNIGLALIGLHRKAEGVKYVKAAIAIDERAGALPSISDSYRELGLYLERAGELKDALDAYHQHRRMADEVFQREQQQAVLELQESFDNDRRNRELELLNRQNRLKEEQLLQRELQQRLWALAAAVGVLTLGIIVLLVQRGRRANALLASTNELLKVQSERDPLTGLANRRHLQQVMRRLAEDGRLAGTVFLMDIDHFKRINDVHGHAAGDKVLVEIASRLRTMLREQDLVVRWGGEEFLVIVQALSPEQVEALAQRLLAALAAEPVDTGSGRIGVTASIGFATLPLEPDGLALSWDRAVELVDTTMYLAKAHGRNRAYGIRLFHAHDEAEVGGMVKTLEQCWRDGRVALTLLQGPAATAEVAA